MKRTLAVIGSTTLLSLVPAAGGDAASGADGVVNAASTAADCPTVLEPVECAHPLTADLVLDGQRMTCSGDLSIRAQLLLTNGSQLASSGRVIVQKGGALVTEGTADCAIRITSSQRVQAAGDWTTIWVTRDAGNNSMLTHTIVEYGGDANAAITLSGGGSIGFDNVTVQHTKGRALDLAGGIVTRFHAVSFNNIPGAPVRIHPDYAAVVEPDIAIDAATVQEPFVDVQPIGRNTMSIDGTWEAIGVPYRLFGDLTFRATLTIGAGARIWIAPAQRFFVSNGGSIKALGTPGNPIEIRSANRVGRPKDWRQIRIQDTAANDSIFRYARISHGGADGAGALSLHPRATVTLDHVTFADNGGCDILSHVGASQATIDATNTTFVACP
jgi:hypothetical protein